MLPSPTQECVENRVDTSKRCNEDVTEEELFGDSRGYCAQPNFSTLKIAAANLQV